MKTLIVLVFIFITLSAAQKSCESLLSGIQDTLEKTQMITRKTTIKARFFEKNWSKIHPQDSSLQF